MWILLGKKYTTFSDDHLTLNNQAFIENLLVQI